MAASKNTIRVWTEVPKKDGIAHETITPGMLIARSAGELIKHASAKAAMYPVLVAEEDELQGKEITDTYAADDQIFFCAPLPGDLVMLLLKDGESVVVDDLLESAGDGTVQKYTNGVPIARAREIKDLSATANTANEHILAEIA